MAEETVREDALAAFQLEEFIDEIEGAVRKVKLCWVGEGKGGRGLVTEKDIEVGEVFLRIPKEIHFCGDEDDLEDLSKRHQMCVSLNRHIKRGEDSKYSKWIATLPKQFTTITAWDDDDLELLGTDLRIKMANRLQQELRNEYPPVEEYLTYDEWCYTNCILRTRGFTTTNNNTEWLLLPYGDMFNHHIDGNADFELDGDDFVFSADRRYKCGEEITLKYNTFGGWDQVVVYGFSDADARHATFPFYIPPLPDLQKAADGEMIDELDLFKQKADPPELFLTKAGPSSDLLRFLRIRYLSHADGIVPTDAPVSTQNEWNTWRAIHSFCRSALRTFQIPESQDTEWLEESNRAPSSRNAAIAVRVADRIILRNVKKKARLVEKQLAKQMILFEHHIL